jgi:type III secretion protein L
MAAVFRLVKGELAPAPGEEVLKAADAAEYFAAEKIVAALAEREREIEARAEELYARSREEGYRDGIAAGKKEYAAKIMETVMGSVEYLEHLETSLVRIVGEIVRKLLGEMEHGEMVTRLVRQALRTVRGERRVTVRVSSKDEAAVRAGLAELLQRRDAGGGDFLDVLPDPDLPPGSCVLESELGVVEASLETQLKNLENALLSRVKQG